MSSLKQIIEAIRQRLADANIDVETGSIDTDRDMPIAEIRLKDPGDQTLMQRPIHKKQVTLDVNLYFFFDEDWLLEGCDHKKQLQEALYKGETTPGSDDRLDGAAIMLEHVGNDIGESKAGEKLAFASATIRITYREN